MQAHHYLGSLAKIGVNLWYVATYLGEWFGLVELFYCGAEMRCAVSAGISGINTRLPWINGRVAPGIDWIAGLRHALRRTDASSTLVFTVFKSVSPI